jgi:hypothetical protein
MILWSCTDPHLLSKTAIKTGEFRNTDNAAQSQKDTYHLALLTLNLGNVNRKLCIGGNRPGERRRTQQIEPTFHIVLHMRDAKQKMTCEKQHSVLRLG